MSQPPKRPVPPLRHLVVFSVALASLSVGAALEAGPLKAAGPLPQAPPTAPPIQQSTAAPPAKGPLPHPLGVTPYSIGQPTDEEQLYLEFLNRMRANPAAEGQRLAAVTDPNILAAYGQFGVDLNLLQDEFATNPPVPPLAMNAQLTAAARWHSGDMFTNQYQGHNQNNGAIVMTPGDRIATNGYSASSWGENVFAYADSVPYGHAGFAVDWGTNAGGMQIPPGHRENMLSPSFREVGMGIVDGVNGSVGPQIITQDLGSQFGSPTFITGVIYYDLNQNGFYDLGEGIGGVMVNTPGSTYYALTASSGGYALPVASNGTYVVTFTAPGLSNNASVTIASLTNRKLDVPLTYTPPTISGPNPAALNVANSFTFSAIPGATAYQWQEAVLSPFTTVDGAENGLANVSASTSPGYSVITNSEHASGTHSFDLVHSQPTPQVLTFNPTLLVSATSQLTFAELLGFAFTNETASAQVSTDGGQSWQAVWSKSGNDGSHAVDSAFVSQSVSLAAYSGQTIQFRFVYDYNGGFYFPGGSGVGLFLDNITVSNAKQVISPVTNSVPSGTAFTFTPMTLTNYLLEVRPQINSRTLAWGPALQLSVTVAAPPPVLSLVTPPVVTGGEVQIDVMVTNFKTGMTLHLRRANSPTGPWTTDSTATLQTIVVNSQFRFTTSTSGAQQLFFRVSGS